MIAPEDVFIVLWSAECCGFKRYVLIALMQKLADQDSRPSLTVEIPTVTTGNAVVSKGAPPHKAVLEFDEIKYTVSLLYNVILHN